MIAAMTDLAASFPSRNPDLLRRIGLTLLALAIYRAGFWVPLPGIDANALALQISGSDVGSALSRMSLMALGVMPLLSALVLAEAAMIAWPRLRAWGGTASGGPRLRHGVVVVALLMAALQANGIAVALETVAGGVPQPGPAFRIGVMVSLVGATAVVVWLASWITRAGIGHGFWVLLAATHIDASMGDVLGQIPLLVQGAVSGSAVLATLGVWLGSLALAAAVLAALVQAGPRLSDPHELVWAPLLGSTLASWLLGGLALVQWLLPPSGLPDLATALLMHFLAPVLFLAIAIVVLLRRRSLGAPDLPANAVAAAPVIAAVGGLVAAASILPAISGGWGSMPKPTAAVVLAAVGLMIVETLRHAQGRRAPADPSSP